MKQFLISSAKISDGSFVLSGRNAEDTILVGDVFTKLSFYKEPETLTSEKVYVKVVKIMAYGKELESMSPGYTGTLFIETGDFDLCCKYASNHGILEIGWAEENKMSYEELGRAINSKISQFGYRPRRKVGADDYCSKQMQDDTGFVEANWDLALSILEFLDR